MSPRRCILASLAGNALEWYDFFLCATAVAIVFGKVFFPEGTDPLVGTLGAFAVLRFFRVVDDLPRAVARLVAERPMIEVRTRRFHRRH